MNTAVQIVICDVGLGNLRSVERALLHAADVTRTPVQVTFAKDARGIKGADKLVMPGQGAFRDCARALDGGLGDAVREHIAKGKPYLGICLGLQVLFGSSAEAEGCAGLGVFEGWVERLPGGIEESSGAQLKIPHVGWNVARGEASNRGLVAADEHYYFVHSYAVVPKDPAIIAATTDYGPAFVSAVAKGNVFACQFHPEKSQGAGIALLGRFLGM